MTVTAAALRALTQSDLDDTAMAPFITTAAVVVSTYLTGIVAGSLKDQIELFLAAHYHTISAEFGGLTYEKVGTSEVRYKSFGYETYGFMTTRFGQQACALDPTKTLIQMSGKNSVSVMFDSISRDPAPETVID